LPVRIICHQCKSVIYEDPELVSPKEILEKNNQKCPKCSTVLAFDPSKLIISVNDTNKKGLLKLFQK
jgi:hypothetical protein